MKFQSLHLFNWLSHQDSMMPLDTLTCYRGENGAGKTSIEQALEMLLTGAQLQHRRQGQRLPRPDPAGADKCAITAEILDSGKLIEDALLDHREVWPHRDHQRPHRRIMDWL